MTAACSALLCVAITAFTAAYCLKTLPQRAVWQVAAAFAMPLGQLAFALSALWVAASHGLANAYLVGMCAAHLLGCAGICALAQEMAKTRSLAINEERLRAAEESAKAASEHEALLAANSTQMRELCNGFADELEALEAKLEKRSENVGADSAEEAGVLAALDFASLNSALANLEETTRSHYCANTTINAILALKARACADAGVDFSFVGGVPQDLSIDELMLCSVFSNLLDNAISAASATDSDAKPRVRVSCAVKGAYLIVKVTNSCAPGSTALPATRRHPKSADPAREHGWGLEIVGDICAAHDGSFTLECTAQSEVCATTILKAVTA